MAKYISNAPRGEDLFDGQSQARLVNAMVKDIVNRDDVQSPEDSMPRIIGLEGAWGSGKSNVIE